MTINKGEWSGWLANPRSKLEWLRHVQMLPRGRGPGVQDLAECSPPQPVIQNLCVNYQWGVLWCTCQNINIHPAHLLPQGGMAECSPPQPVIQNLCVNYQWGVLWCTCQNINIHPAHLLPQGGIAIGCIYRLVELRTN